MRIVLDTNVLVSGLLSPFGPPSEIVRMVSSGAVSLCVDARILSEYEDVLLRPKFGFDRDSVAALLDYIAFRGEAVASAPLAWRLPDPDDEPFLEVALGCPADYLVTGNNGHFPAAARDGVEVLTPAEFVERFRRHLLRDHEEPRESIDRAIEQAREIAEHVGPFDSTAAMRTDRDRDGSRAGQE